MVRPRGGIPQANPYAAVSVISFGGNHHDAKSGNIDLSSLMSGSHV